MPNGKKFKSKALDVDLDNGDKLVVKLNLNACPNNINSANILSIGTNIEEYNKNGDNMIHIYFTKNSKTFNIDRTWGSSNNQKTATLASLEDVTITLSKDDLTISSQKHGYTVHYSEGKAGTFAKFKYENDAYVLDENGNLQLTDDASGKGYYDPYLGTDNYTYAEAPDDTYPTFSSHALFTAMKMELILSWLMQPYDMAHIIMITTYLRKWLAYIQTSQSIQQEMTARNIILSMPAGSSSLLTPLANITWRFT